MSAAGVFPFRTHLTANRLKRGYVEVTVEETCSLFDGGQNARGFVCHSAEILQERVVGGLPAVGSGRRNSLSSRDAGWQAGYSALMQTPGAKPVQEVCITSITPCTKRTPVSATCILKGFFQSRHRAQSPAQSDSCRRAGQTLLCLD